MLSSQQQQPQAAAARPERGAEREHLRTPEPADCLGHLLQGSAGGFEGGGGYVAHTVPKGAPGGKLGTTWGQLAAHLAAKG